MSNDLILSDPEIMGGTPCVKGTRLTVYAVAARIRGGETAAQLLEGYPPEFTEEHVHAAIEYADRVPFVEDSDARPWRKANANQTLKPSPDDYADMSYRIGLATVAGVWIEQGGRMVAAFSTAAQACRWLQVRLESFEQSRSADEKPADRPPEQSAA